MREIFQKKTAFRNKFEKKIAENLMLFKGFSFVSMANNIFALSVSRPFLRP